MSSGERLGATRPGSMCLNEFITVILPPETMLGQTSLFPSEGPGGNENRGDHYAEEHHERLEIPFPDDPELLHQLHDVGERQQVRDAAQGYGEHVRLNTRGPGEEEHGEEDDLTNDLGRSRVGQDPR